MHPPYTWGRCKECQAIWDWKDEVCSICGSEFNDWDREPLKTAPEGTTTPLPRTSIGQASIGIYSFGATTKQATIPMYEFDVFQFRDPMHRYPDLNGDNQLVQEYLKQDPKVRSIVQQVLLLAADHVDHGGSKWLTIGFRDHHEKWIARGLANIVADELCHNQYKVSVINGNS